MFIITNDDGINAEGIKALKEIITEDKVIIAPDRALSGCGHQVTTKDGITVTETKPQEYAISGTPADCVRLGISKIFPSATWVLSGINAGGNLGSDIHISGTVAAVREAAIHGLNAIAISHVIKYPQPINWDIAKKLSKKVLKKLLNKDLPKGCFWNVNLPPLDYVSNPDIVFCNPSIDPLPLNFKQEGNQYFYRGEYWQRKRTIDTDVDVCFSGNIAVSLISINGNLTQN
ncbi:5'/3'-nucleotidase SurE [Cyanobacterium aponinum FACHB-4101]|uniref:5'/3'-nucleotidase SurE n=1 Tax=Cyanobacterium aponinum TaxID=379064 RepID=UPI00168083B6|nr:5'/3'-nucleotidase SurE [Cyanobacterium aponinum]MBD2394411.1 5'/3'-nucleotidase SurE [Cyanobacterium aponinum FACHB-4101]